MKYVFTIFILICSLSISAQTTVVTRKKQTTTTKTKTQNTQNSTTQQRRLSASYTNGTLTINGVNYCMVYVPGGTFIMGATNEHSSDVYDEECAPHLVTLSSYSIGETEVTQELWQVVMGSNPACRKGKGKPVECVSWNDCQTFISKLNSLTSKNFRLPTEAEWEFACRGGVNSQGYKYGGSNILDNVAWYKDNSVSDTHEVARKSPNELGIYDMSGNVYEWCSDWYGPYSNTHQANPKGINSGSKRVIRGGSWFGGERQCSSLVRDDYTPDRSDYYIGLRLAISE